ncbi:hypothetical protein FXO38_33904 [Capsicum annuum]|nr:hypothetical protein FXO38_33904 [Capsicum annuum]KAF3623390.1 hypothetical protein FXO37_31889 [Capsicum annuum]
MLEFVVQSVQSLGLTELKCDSNHLFWVIPVLIVLVTFLLWLQVNWSLTYLIPTVELEKVLLLRHAPKEKVFATKVTGGYKTLRRWVGFGILMYYGLAIVGMVVYCAMFLVSVGAAKGAMWTSFEVILKTALTSVRKYVVVCYYLHPSLLVYY